MCCLEEQFGGDEQAELTLHSPCGNIEVGTPASNAVNKTKKY